MSRTSQSLVSESRGSREPVRAGVYQALSGRRVPVVGVPKIDRGDSARQPSALVLAAEGVIVAVTGGCLTGIGRVTEPPGLLGSDLQFRSVWARDHVYATAFARGAFTGEFRLKDESPGDLPSDVDIFSQKHMLGDYLRKAVDLVKEVFAGYDSYTLEMHHDHETEDEWVVIRVRVQAGSMDVPSCRRRYTSAWVATVPAPDRYLIRLSPDIV